MDKSEQAARRHANYVLGILFLVLMFNFIDRQIVGILADSIKADLGLTDTQVGLMTGLSFAIFYTTLSIPLAIVADRWNRSKVIAIAIAIWSVMTVICGAASSFVQIFLARIGVGIGEAGSSPASHSLIADLFPPERRATALGIFAMSVSVGSFIAFTGGSWLAENFGWRWTLVAAGAPGIIISLIIWFTVRDPRGYRPISQAFKSKPGEVKLSEAIAELSRKWAYWHLIIAGAIVSFVAYGVQTFYFPVFSRIHEVPVSEYSDLGLKLGLMFLVFGSAGAYFGGKCGDYLNARIPGGALLSAALIFVVSTPFMYFALYAKSITVGVLILGIPQFAFSFFFGPCFAAIQTLASDKTRAFSVSIWIMFSGLIGLGLGPLTIGILSDWFVANGSTSATGLQQAVLIVSLFSILAAVFFWLAQRSLKKELSKNT